MVETATAVRGRGGAPDHRLRGPPRSWFAMASCRPTGRGYVLRRLLRRAVRTDVCGREGRFMPEAVDAVIRTMKVAHRA